MNSVQQIWDDANESKISCEVLIIGSGAGGSPTAALLAEAGFDVLVVEEGRWVEQGTVAPFSLDQMEQQYGTAKNIVEAFGKPIATMKEELRANLKEQMTGRKMQDKITDDVKITPNNRAYKYGDSVFETLKLVNGKLIFWEAHYFRLMASMRMLRMKIPMSFTLEFLENEILKTAKVTNSNNNLRIRLTITRKDGGFYLPLTNEVDYLIEYHLLY